MGEEQSDVDGRVEGEGSRLEWGWGCQILMGEGRDSREHGSDGEAGAGWPAGEGRLWG